MKRAEFKEGDKGVIKAVLIIIGKNDCVIQVRWLNYYRVLIIRQVFVGMSLIGRLCGYWLRENDIYKHQIVISLSVVKPRSKCF